MKIQCTSRSRKWWGQQSEMDIMLLSQPDGYTSSTVNRQYVLIIAVSSGSSCLQIRRLMLEISVNHQFMIYTKSRPLYTVLYLQWADNIMHNLCICMQRLPWSHNLFEKCMEGRRLVSEVDFSWNIRFGIQVHKFSLVCLRPPKQILM